MITDFIFLLALLATAASFIRPAWLLGVVIFLALLWLGRIVQMCRAFWRDFPGWLPLSGLLLMLLVTLWATALPEITLPQVYRLLNGILLLLLALELLKTPQQFKRFWWLVTLIAPALAVFAPFSVAWFPTKLPFVPLGLYERFTILVADAVNPNVMAGSLILFIAPAMGVWLFSLGRAQWKTALLLTFSLLFSGAMLALTQSRSAVLALFAAGLLILTLRFPRLWILLLAFALTLVFLPRLPVLAPLVDAFFADSSLDGLNGRVEIWSRAIYMIQDFAFTGVGMGSFGRVADLLYPFFLVAPGKITHAHNLFLQVAVDLGIPGLIFWLALFFTLWVQSWQVYRFGKNHADMGVAGIGAGLLGALLAQTFHGLFDAVTWGEVRSAPLVWLLWAVIAVSWNVYVRVDISRMDENIAPVAE